MVSTPVLSTPSKLDSFLDPDYPVFGFATETWVDPPTYVPSDGEESDIQYQRKAHADAFKQHDSPVAWICYTTLGYYVYSDCSEFESHWRQFTHKQTICSKMIWYNFMYHVDRNINIPPKLQSWATNVAHPHLSQLDPSFLRIDTQRTTWAQLLPHAQKMDEDRPWTVVGKQKAQSKSDSKPSSLKVSARICPPILAKTPTFSASKLSSLRTASKSSTTKSPTPATAPPLPNLQQPPPPPPIPSVTPPNVWKTRQRTPHSINDTSSTQNSTSSGPPHMATNDGTYCLTFRWKPKSNYTHLAGHQTDWLNELLVILKLLFSDCDGVFYCWESADLAQSSPPVSLLSPEQLHDFISPRLASLDSHSTFVFSIRFSFDNKSPFQWRNHSYTKQTLANNGLGLPMSNSLSDNGRLVIAGYILFKAPNTTHRISYLQRI